MNLEGTDWGRRLLTTGAEPLDDNRDVPLQSAPVPHRSNRRQEAHIKCEYKVDSSQSFNVHWYKYQTEWQDGQSSCG
jgi:hypothetical protein